MIPAQPAYMKKKSHGGFTLVEVLIVVLLLGLLAMMGTPTLISGMDRYRLSSTATEIITTIEFAQMTAMTAGGKTRITINDVNDTILIEKFTPDVDLLGVEAELDEADVEGGSYKTMGHPTNKGVDYQIEVGSEDRFHGVDILTSTFGAGNFIIFDALGAPSDGGTVTLSLGGSQATLTVDALTGKVTAGI